MQSTTMIRRNYIPKGSTIRKKAMYQALWGGHDLDRMGKKYFGKDYKRGKKKGLLGESE